MKYLLTTLLALATLPLFSQIKFNIGVLPDGETYQVSFVPDITYPFPGYLLASGQITIRVPHGIGPNSFVVADLTMSTAGGWQDNSRVNAPVEAPSWDYISFGLITFGTNAYPFVAGVELPVFTFKNDAPFCADSVEIVDNATDPFLPPNSAGANIGNTIVVLGGGLVNSYGGTVGTGIVPCLPQTQCSDETVDNIYLCNGEPYMGMTITQDTSWDVHYTSFAGCDSALITNVIVWQDNFPAVDTAICQGKIFNGTTIMQDTEIEIVHTSVGGCDSTVTYHIEVLMPSSSSESVSVLPGQAVLGTPVYSDTIIVQNLTAANGCDSTHTVNVTVFQVPTTVLNVPICQGDFYQGQAWPQDTTLIVTLTASTGFDSILVTNIFVNPVYQIVKNVALCQGGTYLGIVYNADDSLFEDLQTTDGCDSTITTIINVLETQVFSLDTAICQGGLYLGQTFESDTVFQVILFSSQGCDSIVYLTNLIVWAAPNAAISGDLEICGGETSLLTAAGGNAFTWSTGETGASITVNTTQAYSVTVTSQQGCTATANVQMQVSSLDVVLETLPPACTGDQSGSIHFPQVNGGIPPYAYSIDGGSFYTTHTDFPNLSPGIYEVKIRDASGCFWENEVEITDPVSYFLDLGHDESIRLGDSVDIDVLTNLGTPASIEWLPAEDASICDTCLSQSVMPLETTTYRLTLTDSLGCRVEGKIHVAVDSEHRVYVPTAFSPNGDGFNDLLTVQSDGTVANVRQFIVFERWGGQVFLRENFLPNDFALGWDGTWRGEEVPLGTFIWLAEVEFIDGQVEVFEGGVVVVK